MLICRWLGYSTLNIWLGRGKSWYFSTNEISHNGHFFILNNFLEFMTFVFKHSYFIFALYSFISFEGKIIETIILMLIPAKTFFQCQQMCNQNLLLCLCTKKTKIVFGNKKVLTWNILTAGFRSIILQMMQILLLSPLISVWEAGF